MWMAAARCVKKTDNRGLEKRFQNGLGTLTKGRKVDLGHLLPFNLSSFNL